MIRLLSTILALISAITSFAVAAGGHSPISEGIPDVSLVTIGAGKEVYQLEGHTLLRITYPDGRDIAVNWGIFDFSTPNFAYRFLKGETDYSVGVSPFPYILAEYNRERRSVVEQRLNLTVAETDRLLNLISDNLLPENRIYRYNYVKDNCATRPMRLIEQSLAADTASLLIDMPTVKTSFRNEMRRYHRDFPAYQLFIDIVLGSGIDYPLTTRERAFAPLFLMDMAANSIIINADGTERPLAEPARTLSAGPETPYTEGIISPWLFIAAISVTAIAITWRDQRRKKVTRWFDTIFYGILGLVGLLLTFLIFVSVHEATSPNINYLWINPICLVVPLLIWVKRCRKIVFCYQIANFVALIVFIAGVPLFNQSGNWMFLPLILSDLARSANYIILNRR